MKEFFDLVNEARKEVSDFRAILVLMCFCMYMLVFFALVVILPNFISTIWLMSPVIVGCLYLTRKWWKKTLKK